MATPAFMVKAAEENLKILLADAFADTISFGPFYVEPSTDCYGEDNIDIIVFYDGDYALMDPNKLNRVASDLWVMLQGLGFQNTPTDSYIDIADYDLWVELNNTPPWLLK